MIDQQDSTEFVEAFVAAVRRLLVFAGLVVSDVFCQSLSGNVGNGSRVMHHYLPA
jgi:hypothetical protein